MLSFRKRLVIILKDSISFIIYIFMLVFSRKRERNITLVYHSVGYIDPRKDLLRLNIIPENFDKHLKIISKYRDKIEITFDDGYGNNFENAFPLLKRYNLCATMFLITDFLDGKIRSEHFAGKNFKERPLTWEEIRIMDKAGIRFGSHSKTHSFLTSLPKDRMGSELVDSKRRIENIVDHQIDRFSYPFGNIDSFNGLTKDALINANYKYAYTNIMGGNLVDRLNDDRFTLKRIRIFSEDGPFKLKIKIKGAYDWVDKIGIIKKIIK